MIVVLHLGDDFGCLGFEGEGMIFGNYAEQEPLGSLFVTFVYLCKHTSELFIVGLLGSFLRAVWKFDYFQ